MTGRIRLTTGLILFVFVAGHLLNHILGLHSLAAMEAGRDWFILIWRNSVGAALLMGSLTAHLLLAGWALYSRRSLKMSGGEEYLTFLLYVLFYRLFWHCLYIKVNKSKWIFAMVNNKFMF